MAGFGETAWSGTSFAYGDVHQVVTDNVNGRHPIGAGVASVSLYCDRALRLAADPPLRSVVAFPADASGKGAGTPVIVAGEVGKGRVVVSSDVMLFQPGRIDRADNARLLKNLVDYLAPDETKPPRPTERKKRELTSPIRVFSVPRMRV